LVVGMVILVSLSTYSQQKLKMQKNRVLIILDESNSMNNQWQTKPKISVVRDQVGALIDKCSKYGELEFGLRLFGHQFPNQVNNCNDTKFVVNFALESGAKIKSVLVKVKPKGTSPIEASLARVDQDYNFDTFNKRTVILIVDGVDACNAKICDTYKELASSGKYENIFLVGVNIDPEFVENYKCFDSFTNVTNEADLKPVFDSIFTKIKPY